MPTWSKDTGTTGKMEIRDNGDTVEFWIRSGQSVTTAFGKTFSWSGKGGSGTGTYDYPSGNAWLHLKTVTVTSSGDVAFTINATGTQALGGPTTFLHYIDRDTVPSQVRSLSISEITGTSFKVNFTAPSDDGGDAIDFYLIRWSENNPPNVAPYSSVQGNSGTKISGLKAGTKYYVTVYAHNSVGYSLLASPVSATPVAVPGVPFIEDEAVFYNTIGPTTTISMYWGDAEDNGSAVTGFEVRYGTTNPPNGSPIADNASPYISPGLPKNTTYYFQVRAKNAVGAGPWTSSYSIETPDVPIAPKATGISLITPTSMRFQFSSSPDAGFWEPDPTGYEYQYSTSSAFTGASTIAVTTNNLVDRSGLIPGTLYYFRVRSKNVVGASAWSNVLSATTLPAVRVKVGGVWKMAIPYIKINGVWKMAQPFVKVAGIWKKAI